VQNEIFYSTIDNFKQLTFEIYLKKIDIQKLGKLLRAGKIKENSVTVTTPMSETMSQMIRQNAIEMIKTQSNLSEVSTKIRDFAVENFGGIWQVFVYKECFGTFNISHNEEKYIKISISGLNIILFRTRE
jgi:hypothetical protein